jgi:O-antigen ligase
VLLALHITGAAAWLGANFVQLVLNPRFDGGDRAVAAAWTRQQVWLGERYYGPVGALIALTGVLLVLDGDWSWGSGFIWVGITVVVVGGVLGVAAFAPFTRARADALDRGDAAAAERSRRRTLGLALLDTALVLLAVLAMVDKWQA